MASHTYSTGELLHVRERPLREDIHRKLYSRLRRDADLDELIKVQPLQPTTRHNQLARLDDVALHQSQPRQLDGVDGEWRYRRRTDSEHADRQPISAPSGLAAQKSEGFQRFYKAVVSPSHVRVTAGGRIVPNTRIIGSPEPKWPTEKVNDTNTASADRFAENHETGAPAYNFPFQINGFAPVSSMYPGLVPGMIPSPVASPYAIMPWQMAMGYGAGFPMAPPLAAYSQPHMPPPSEARHVSRSDKRSDTGGSVKAASVQGPSPEKNHQQSGAPWMMQHGQSPFPAGLMPPSGYAYSPLPGQMLPPQGTHIGAYGGRVQTSKSSQHSAMSAPGPYGMPGFAVAQTPISSIRPSEITKKQIDVLRNSLKYLEDQLSFNRHQIDEKAIEGQAETVKQQIKHFEKNLDNQLTFEGTRYPKPSSTKLHSTRSESSRGARASKASVVSEDSAAPTPYKLNNASNTSLAPSVRSRPCRDRKTGFSTGINSTKSVSAFAPMKCSLKAMTQYEATQSLSGLPSTAALAPPFQPLGRDLVPRASENSQAAAMAKAWDQHDRISRGHDVAVHPNYAGMGDQRDQAHNVPYLVGFIPQGTTSNLTEHGGYAYTRALNEDELRARHMYWGKTPHHLQKGLPKFDGKDFYPPSPTKERGSYSTGSGISERRLPVGDVAADHRPSQQANEAALFQSVAYAAPRASRGPLGIPTQSEALARSHSGTDEVEPAFSRRGGSCITDVGQMRLSESSTDALVKASVDLASDRSSSNGDEDKDLLFKGRKASRQAPSKAHNEIWRNMLKKSRSSGNAAPGAVSSTTVQGLLPQYAGYATASLTPTIANSTTPPRSTMGKAFDSVEQVMMPTAGDRNRENLPPGASCT